MYICYVDEAGCTGELHGPASAVQPAFVLTGLIIPAGKLQSLTLEWIRLKQTYFPKRLPQTASIHDWMVAEVKGSDIRKMARDAARNDRRFATQVLGSAIDMLERHGASVVSRVFVKPIGGPFDGTAVYTSSVQAICRAFQTMLWAAGDIGIVVADSRNKGKNSNVAHSIFTQRYAAGGDPYAQIIEMPTFGHSENHAGLQLADFICSGLLFPIAVQKCASPYLTDHTHCSDHYLKLGQRFGPRLRDLQFRDHDHQGLWVGGITLIDRMGHLQSTVLFG